MKVGGFDWGEGFWYERLGEGDTSSREAGNTNRISWFRGSQRSSRMIEHKQGTDGKAAPCVMSDFSRNESELGDSVSYSF